MTLTRATAKELQKKGVEARAKNKDDLWAFLSSGGARKYHELLDKQLEDEKVGKEQEKGMDRVEKLFPYVKARRTDEDKDGNTVNAVLVKFVDDKS